MNQELLTGAIAFFKEQNGTYESMKAQMLAGGISLVEINQVYAEIQKLGLDPNGKYMKAMEKANPIAVSKITIHPVSAEMPLTSKVLHTEMAHESYATVPQPTTPDTQAPILSSLAPVIPIPVPQVEPTPINTFHGMTSVDTFTNQTSTPPLPTVATTSSNHFLVIFLTLFLLLGLGAGGVFTYTKYAPQSAFALVVTSTLQNFGLVQTPKIKPLPVKDTATTTSQQESVMTVSATVVATQSNMTATSSSSTSTQIEVNTTSSSTLKDSLALPPTLNKK